MRRHIGYIILVITILTLCDATPFRQRRQIEEQNILTHIISDGDVLDVEAGLEGSDGVPIIAADIPEVTQAALGNSHNDVADGVDVNRGSDDEVANDRGIPDHGAEVNLQDRPALGENEHSSEHDYVDHDPVLGEVFRDRNISDHSSEVQSRPDLGTFNNQQTTVSNELSEHLDRGQREIGEENDHHHNVFPDEIIANANNLLNMTDTSHQRLFTLSTDRGDSDNVNPDIENRQSVTGEHPVISNTERAESAIDREHLPTGSGEEARNSSNAHGGNLGDLNSIGHSSQDHETELNNHNNEGPDVVGQGNGVDIPIDKGTHPREPSGVIEPVNPPRHTYNPITTNNPTTPEPTEETRTNPNIATPQPTEPVGVRTGEILIPTEPRTTTEHSVPDEHINHASGSTGEHEHIGETGESHLHGINGEGTESGESGETANPLLVPTEISHTASYTEEKQPKFPEKDVGKYSHSGHWESSTFLTVSSQLVPTPTIESNKIVSHLSTSFSIEIERMSTHGHSYFIKTNVPNLESVEYYDTQTFEYFSSEYYPDYLPDFTTIKSVLTTTPIKVQPQSIFSTLTSSLVSISLHSEPPFATQSSVSSSMSSADIGSTMSIEYPEIVPTPSSIYESPTTTLSNSLSISASGQRTTQQIVSSPFPSPSESDRSVVASTSGTFHIPSPSSSASSSITQSMSALQFPASQSGVVNSTSSSTSISSTTSSTTTNTLNTILIARTTGKKQNETMTTNVTTTAATTTRKKPDSDKDKPENASSTTHVISTPLTTHNMLNVAPTSQKTIISTPPSTYIEIELRMDWLEFCSSKILFISQIRNTIMSEKEITVPLEQFKLTTEYCRDVNPTILNTGSIQIQMYVVDTDGKIDIRLTLVTCDLIVKGFQDSNLFKDKIVSVHIHPNKMAEQIPKEKTLRKPTSPDVTMVIVIASVGGVCCVALIILQVILIHRRVKSKKKQKPLMSHRTSIQSLDHVALGVIPKSRPGSGYWNAGMDDTLEVLEVKELSHVLSFSLLANVCMDPTKIHVEFQTIPFNSPESPSVVYGEEDKNRFANVLPYKHSRVKLKTDKEHTSDYINANYVKGYKGAKCTYIATQSPLVNTVEDFWRMVWEQQSRAVLMINPVTQYSKPKQSTCYWPDNLETDFRREYGDFTVTLTKRDVQSDYIDCTLELMDIERNLKREVHHFWYTCWSDSGAPEPLSFVKFVLDTRPHYENSGAPVVVHCGPGTGRTGTFMAVDICMRMFEDKRRVDIQRCVHKMRQERAGAVQTKEQYLLIYQALNEYGVILSSPSISTRSSVVTLHAML